MAGQIGRQDEGYVVIAVPGSREGKKSLPDWAFRHFGTKEEALEAAETFAGQQEGFEALVIRAEAYFCKPFRAGSDVEAELQEDEREKRRKRIAELEQQGAVWHSEGRFWDLGGRWCFDEDGNLLPM